MPIERRWLTPAEAAERMGISRKRIYNMISLKKIPYSKPPGMGCRIDWKAIEAMYEKAQIHPAGIQ